MPGYVVCALYKFVRVAGYKEMRKPLLNLMLENRIKGTLLLAEEGINGTVSGDRTAIDNLLEWLNSDLRFDVFLPERDLSARSTCGASPRSRSLSLLFECVRVRPP